MISFWFICCLLMNLFFTRKMFLIIDMCLIMDMFFFNWNVFWVLSVIWLIPMFYTFLLTVHCKRRSITGVDFCWTENKGFTGWCVDKFLRFPFVHYRMPSWRFLLHIRIVCGQNGFSTTGRRLINLYFKYKLYFAKLFIFSSFLLRKN